MYMLQFEKFVEVWTFQGDMMRCNIGVLVNILDEQTNEEGTE